ncbi:MAG: hypothetical protein AB7V27_19875, partial [Candidatus Binatia bacterium]
EGRGKDNKDEGRGKDNKDEGKAKPNGGDGGGKGSSCVSQGVCRGAARGGDEDDESGHGGSCVPLRGSCEKRDLPVSICDPEEEKCSASSPEACKAAKESECELIPPREAQCTVCPDGGEDGEECRRGDRCERGRSSGGTCEPSGLICAAPETCGQLSCRD